MNRFSQWLGTVAVMAGMAGGAYAAFPIGGLTPDRRPEGAPVIASDTRSPAWITQALRGITEPYPQSLLFLMSQGNWYTPFDRPGMTGRYDIRGWHRAP